MIWFQKRREKDVIFSQEPYNGIKQYEEVLKKNNKYIKGIRITPDEVSIFYYFMFEEWEDLISRKFKNRFRGAQNNLI